MKFGQHLLETQFLPWKNEYINYDQLKHFLKERQLSPNGWTHSDEEHFTAHLVTTELDKVHHCIQVKKEQLDGDEQKISDLIQFINLNDIGFYKILKKHDKWTGYSLLTSPRFHDLHQHFQNILIELGQIKRKEEESFQSTELSETTTTIKYWVHLDNLKEVEAILLFHLPAAASDIINTVYFDNPNRFILYSDLLERMPDAELIRARWYGTTNTNKDIFFESKVHQESWLHNKGSSKTDRFKISQSQVESYLALGHEKNNSVSTRIFQSMQKNKLRPTLRTYHHRTTYSSEKTLRISVDSNLTFIKEESSTWKPKDVSDDYPFEHLCKDQVLYFPYAVLEIKTNNYANVPDWLTQFIESSQLVYQVPYFSKYVHGVSLFFRNKLPLLPWWLSEMDLDIRKKSSYATIQSNNKMGACIVIEPPLIPDYMSEKKQIYNTQISSCTLLEDATTLHDKKETRFEQFLQCKAMTKLKQLKQKYTEGGQPRSENYVSMVSWFCAKLTNNQTILQSPQYGLIDQPQVMPKKGKLKKKVEPNLFFSNERTFISWLQFSALLLSVSLGLINFGDTVSKASGGFFILIAIVLAAYAQLRFQYRAWQIRFRGDSRFDDVYGPAVLCMVLVLALIVNLGLRVSQPLPENPSYFGVNQTVPMDEGFLVNEALPGGNGLKINETVLVNTHMAPNRTKIDRHRYNTEDEEDEED